MNSFAELVRRLGLLVGMGAFGCSLMGAFSAGVDPLTAMIRAGGSTFVLLLAYWALCKTIVPILGANPKPATQSETVPSGS